MRVEADGTVTTGITAHAQDELGDIVYVQAPEPGRRVTQGEACGVVESVKTAADLHAPVSGEVVAVNSVTADHPERINSDPYGTWLFRIRPRTPRGARRAARRGGLRARGEKRVITIQRKAVIIKTARRAPAGVRRIT